MTAPVLLTSAQVAAALGVSARRVQQLARSRGVGALLGRDLVFTQGDLEALRERKPGRPPHSKSAGPP